MGMFGKISVIELRHSLFRQIKLHRNNRLYGIILKVCQLIFENSLPAEEPGTWKFPDFTRDERKMNQLFEAFVRNFYRIEQHVFKVRRENINWKLQPDTPELKDFLPIMQTDITLENQSSKIILDAKFYRETMVVNYDKEKIRSANLYQIFSYLLNQEDGSERAQTASGILLYPTIEQDYDLDFRYKNHRISIRTVNLNTNWKAIEKRLKEIILIY
jgi:5-methylcytosine-specific restriction enzyme subunit McrC